MTFSLKNVLSSVEYINIYNF